jgi:hypothetical protein
VRRVGFVLGNALLSEFWGFGMLYQRCWHTHISWVVFRRADPDQNMAQRLNFFATMAPDGLFGDVILSQRESAVWVTPSRISSR